MHPGASINGKLFFESYARTLAGAAVVASFPCKTKGSKDASKRFKKRQAVL